MARFTGIIGYAVQSETAPGVWTDSLVEKSYRGDIITDQRRYQLGDKVNDDINIDNSISIVANAYAYANIGIMKYVVFNGMPWKIQSFEIKRPRIILQLGGIYNGERPNQSS